MTNYPVTLNTPVGSGTVATNLTESIWLGAETFVVVASQTTPSAWFAQVVLLSADPYNAGTTQSVASTLYLGSAPLIDRPMLVRLDYNRLVVFYSNTLAADTYAPSTSTTVFGPAQLVFSALVLEIDSSNNLSVVFSGASMAPGAFLNWTNLLNNPTTSKANNVAYSTEPFPRGYPNSSFLAIATNRVLACVRETHWATGSTSNYSASTAGSFVALYDIAYASTTGSSGPGTLTITKRYINSASGVTYGTCYSPTYIWNFAGQNDYPWIYKLPNTTTVIFGYINYDPNNALNRGSTTTDLYAAVGSVSAMYTGNVAYLADYTQSATSWTTSSTISFRRGAVMCPLDAGRLLEITSQTVTSTTATHARVYFLSSGSWSNDIMLDYSAATSNMNGTLAFGCINQITPLGSDHMILSISNRTSKAAYWGIYRLMTANGNSTQPLSVQATAYGAPPLAPYTFQRGLDAIIPRVVNDPDQTSAYDFFARSSNLSYTFMRYANPS